MTSVLHSSGTFVNGKMTISREVHDVINAFKIVLRRHFEGKGTIPLTNVPEGCRPQLSWKGLFLRLPVTCEDRHVTHTWKTHA
jgi:hypothetical protein